MAPLGAGQAAASSRRLSSPSRCPLSLTAPLRLRHVVQVCVCVGDRLRRGAGAGTVPSLRTSGPGGAWQGARAAPAGDGTGFVPAGLTGRSSFEEHTSNRADGFLAACFQRGLDLGRSWSLNVPSLPLLGVVFLHLPGVRTTWRHVEAPSPAASLPPTRLVCSCPRTGAPCPTTRRGVAPVGLGVCNAITGLPGPLCCRLCPKSPSGAP